LLAIDFVPTSAAYLGKKTVGNDFCNHVETYWMAVDWIERNSIWEIHISMFLVDIHSEEIIFVVNGAQILQQHLPYHNSALLLPRTNFE
jgi:hypothetical protein